MTQNKTVTAALVPASRYVLVTNIALPESGAVTLSPLQPAEGYLAGENVALSANANPGYVFSHWEGSLEGSANPYDIVIDDNSSVTAVFNPTVQVIRNPSAGGTVTMEPAQGPGGYVPATEVVLSAVAAEGYIFNGWSGDVSGFDNPLPLTVDGPKNVTANFLAQSSFPWRWVIIGVVGFFLLALLAYFVRSELSRD